MVDSLLTLPLACDTAASSTKEYVRYGEVYSSLNGGTPNIAAGTGAGTTPTGPTIGANAVDGAFVVTLTTGTSCATASAIFTITLSAAAAHQSIVTFAPGNAATAALSGAKSPYVDTPVGAVFDFKSGATALSDGTAYVWYFHVRAI